MLRKDLPLYMHTRYPVSSLSPISFGLLLVDDCCLASMNFAIDLQEINGQPYIDVYNPWHIEDPSRPNTGKTSSKFCLVLSDAVSNW